MYEAGDIVSILDEEGQLYYALIRGFLEDQYAEKYAVLTWLLPTVPNPKSFDPALFVLGRCVCVCVCVCVHVCMCASDLVALPSHSR